MEICNNCQSSHKILNFKLQEKKISHTFTVDIPNSDYTVDGHNITHDKLHFLNFLLFCKIWCDPDNTHYGRLSDSFVKTSLKKIIILLVIKITVMVVPFIRLAPEEVNAEHRCLHYLTLWFFESAFILLWSFFLSFFFFRSTHFVPFGQHMSTSWCDCLRFS